MAGFARSPSQAVPASVRNALDVSGNAAAGIGCDAVRAADRHHQHRLSLHGAGAAGRDRRSRPTSCSSRCGAIPGRRLRPARPLRRRATARRSSWRSPPTTWCATPARFVAACRAGSGCCRSRAHRDVRRSAGTCRPPNTAISARATPFPARSARSRNSSRSRTPATAADYIKAGYLWNSGNFMFRAAVLLDEYRNFDAESVAGRHRCRHQGRARSRIFHA